MKTTEIYFLIGNLIDQIGKNLGYFELEQGGHKRLLRYTEKIPDNSERVHQHATGQ